MAEEPDKIDNEIKTLSAKRRGKLGACTRKLNELKPLLADTGNSERVLRGVEQLKVTLDEFKDAHAAVQMLLPSEIKENETLDWYEPKMETFENFLKEVDSWNTFPPDPQMLINPHDSISNVDHESRTSKCSKQTRQSATSIASAHLKVATEKAALQARMSTLKQKQALEMKKNRLQAELERMELEEHIAESEAKLKVFDSFYVGPERHSTVQERDGMNEYLTSHIAKTSLHSQPRAQIHALALDPSEPAPLLGPRTSEPPRSESSEESDSSSHSRDLVTVIQRQNDIADLLMLHQKQSSLPSRQIPVFDGDPLSFQTFMRAFKHGIENKTSCDDDRLYYLEQYTSGQPRELVRSCFHMEPERGYAEARRLLKVHFGDGLKIANAYMEKALNWSMIKPDDGKALHAYALYLRGCCNAMKELKSMEELDLVSTLKLIVSKLPYKLREKWRNTAFELLERNQRRATFSDLVVFIEKQASILQDPLFGDIHDVMPSQRAIPKATTSYSKQQINQRGKSSSFAMAIETRNCNTASPKSYQRPESLVTNRWDGNCCICKKGKHSLNECEMLKLQPRDVKVKLLKEKGICFGCLTRGHMSKACRKRSTCLHCQGSHR